MTNVSLSSVQKIYRWNIVFLERWIVTTQSSSEVFYFFVQCSASLIQCKRQQNQWDNVAHKCFSPKEGLKISREVSRGWDDRNWISPLIDRLSIKTKINITLHWYNFLFSLTITDFIEKRTYWTCYRRNYVYIAESLWLIAVTRENVCSMFIADISFSTNDHYKFDKR